LSQVTLAIRHLQDEQISLREAGLYWVALDQPADANLIACQFLSSLQQTHAATLTCCGQDPATVIASMASDAGPGALRLFSVPDDAAIRAAFNAFTSDLSRINVRQGSYLVLMLAASPVENLSRDQLHRWIDGMRQWLDEQACTLLVLCHGQAPALHERLLAFNEDISGLAQLYRRDGGICYQLNFWHSDKGVCAAQAFDLVLENDVFGLSVTQLSSPPQTRTDDQRIYLTQRSVLEGAPPLSEQWRLFEHRDDLLEQAGHARAASVIMALESNQEVELLARRLHGLRERCGVGLKVIVREMEPCLRYRDERLLLACGANLIVPFKTPLAHFLSLVDSVQGQTWRHRQVANVEMLFDRLRPPAQRGLLAPLAFITTLDQIYGSASGEVTHQLLRLRPRGDLDIDQYLNQITLRRFGDIACVLDGYFYLFLFACRADGLEPALGNICRLPWRDIFSVITPLSTVDDLTRQAFLDAPHLSEAHRMASEQVTDNLVQAIARAGYIPQRISLPLSEPCP
jgi:cellulose biosynthesis protein BcsE